MDIFILSIYDTQWTCNLLLRATALATFVGTDRCEDFEGALSLLCPAI